jgi:hypothetical protein
MDAGVEQACAVFTDGGIAGRYWIQESKYLKGLLINSLFWPTHTTI